jgi:hypothetical protein
MKKNISRYVAPPHTFRLRGTPQLHIQILWKKNSAPKKYPTLCMISLYIMYVITFNIKIIFHFPKKNNFMLVTPRTEMYEGVLHI